MYITTSELYNGFFGIFLDKYYELSDAKRNKIKHKYNPKKIFLETFNYDVWSEN